MKFWNCNIIIYVGLTSILILDYLFYICKSKLLVCVLLQLCYIDFPYFVYHVSCFKQVQYTQKLQNIRFELLDISLHLVVCFLNYRAPQNNQSPRKKKSQRYYGQNTPDDISYLYGKTCPNFVATSFHHPLQDGQSQSSNDISHFQK